MLFTAIEVGHEVSDFRYLLTISTLANTKPKRKELVYIKTADSQSHLT